MKLSQLVPARVDRKLRLLTAAGSSSGDSFDACVTSFQRDSRADTAAVSDASRSLCDLNGGFDLLILGGSGMATGRKMM